MARLRLDPAPQLADQASLEAVASAWRQHSDTQSVLRDLETYGSGKDLTDCHHLQTVISEVGKARRWLDKLILPMIRGLAAHPLGHVPLRFQFTPGLMVMQIASAGRAALSLVCYEARDHARAQTVCFSDGARHELCLAGAADARIFLAKREQGGAAELAYENRRIEAGDAFTFTDRKRTKIVDRPKRRLVMLRLSLSDPAPTPAREYRIADGALVHCASGDRSESRDEMPAAVLGAMGRIDAAPAIADIATGAGSEHFRWQALCQALALDTAVGFDALTALALDPADSLAAQAGALRATLVERHPALARWNAPCPVS